MKKPDKDDEAEGCLFFVGAGMLCISLGMWLGAQAFFATVGAVLVIAAVASYLGRKR